MSTQADRDRRRCLWLVARCAAFLGLGLLVACASQPGSPSTAAADCGFGCVQWVEQCDSDPRGQVRCYRRCARVGDTCSASPAPEGPVADPP